MLDDHVGGIVRGRGTDAPVGRVLIAQQRFDLLAECLVTRACLTKERGAIRCAALERCMAELRDLALPVGRHLGARLVLSVERAPFYARGSGASGAFVPFPFAFTPPLTNGS